MLRKAVGTESELRVEVVSQKFDSCLTERMTDIVGPELLVKQTIETDRDHTNAISEEAALRIDDINSEFNFKNPSVAKSVQEHLDMVRYAGTKKHYIKHKQGHDVVFEDTDKATEKYSLELQRVGLSGSYLRSGFRVYRDVYRPEICTPECLSPYDLVCWEKAGEILVSKGAESVDPSYQFQLQVYKNNSDGFGNSWGAHENYFVSSELFDDLVYSSADRAALAIRRLWMTFLVTRFIYCGSGKIGSEFEPVKWNLPNNFLISQRAEFIEQIRNGKTTYERPLIETRDIPYADPDIGRRLHVIIGDANMMETPIYLKVGMAMIVLMMFEDVFGLDELPFVVDPIRALYSICSDLSCKNNLDVYYKGDRKTMSAVDIQKIFCSSCLKWLEECFDGSKAVQQWSLDVINKCQKILDVLADDPINLDGVLDWVTKYAICSSKLDKMSKSWEDLNDETVRQKIVGWALGYHLMGDKGIYARLARKGKVKRIVSDSDIANACINPPADSRAHDRMTLIDKCRGEIGYMSWHKIKLRGSVINLNTPYRNFEA